MSDGSQKANELRKAGEYEAALRVYQESWKEKRDEFVGAGLLHCLRKLRRWNEAKPLADELIQTYPNFNWVRIEFIWTYTEGVLNQLDEQAPPQQVIAVAEAILSLLPDDYPRKRAIFSVLTSAKRAKRWDILPGWIDRLRPEHLDLNPMQTSSGREGWSEQGLWYHYKILSLIETGRAGEALPYCEEALNRFPKQFKFFKRNQAIAHLRLGNYEAAADTYWALCQTIRPDWWILREYGVILSTLGREEEALQVLCQAMQSDQKIGMMVGLFEDLGDLYADIGQPTKALDFFTLSSRIREENSWAVSDTLGSKIESLRMSSPDYVPPVSVQEAMQRCDEHRREVIQDAPSSHQKRSVRKNLEGVISLGSPDRAFCFIRTYEGEDIICYKDQLPIEIRDRERVVFDAVPSFDRKKNQESWKGVNIQVS